MTVREFPDYTLFSFWGNIDYPSNKDALRARNAFSSKFRGSIKIVKSSLPHQMRKYYELGHPDGRSGTVYYLKVYDKKLRGSNG